MKKSKSMGATFINHNLDRFVREFTKKEIKEWDCEDKLVAPKKIVTPKMFLEES